MVAIRQLYRTVAGYGCIIEEDEDGTFTAHCEPVPGTELTVQATNLEGAQTALAAAIYDYEAQALEKETTLQEIPTEG